MSRSVKRLMVSLCGALLLSTPAIAQAVDQVANADPAPLTAPQAENDSAPAREQPADATSPNLGQGTKAQAEHSAEATAHKSVSDPNNQLGTSLQGRTRPIAGADVDSQATASAAQPGQ